MTPVTGFIAAVIAGMLVRDGRRAGAAIALPYLAVLALQTYSIAAGDGHSPPSTVSQLPGAIGYWAIQVIFLALSLGIAAMLGALRARRGTSDPDSTRRQALVAGGVLTAAAAAVVTGVAFTLAPVHHHNAGRPPIYGTAAMVLCVLTFAVLGVVTLLNRRRDRRGLTDADPALTATGAAGSGLLQ